MKYLINAARKSKGLYYLIANAILVFGYVIVNAKILNWIALAIQSEENAMTYVNMVIVGCLINVLLSALIRYTTIGDHILFTYMNNMYADKILDADYDLFTVFSPGKLITVGESIWKMTRLLRTYLQTVKDIINFAVNLVAACLIVPIATIPLVIVYLILGVFLHQVIKKWIRIDEEMDNIRHQRNGELDDITNGFTAVRSFENVSDAHKESIHNLNERILKMVNKRSFVSVQTDTGVGIADGLITIATMLYVVIGIKDGNTILSGIGLTFIMYVWRMMSPFCNLIDDISSLSDYKAPVKNFEAVMDYKNTVSNGITELETFDREIIFKDVKFSYDKSRYVLNGVSFSVKKGEHVGICGTSGGGKSTLLKLIPKFYDVTDGEILIDGINIKDLSNESLRKHIGVVHQDTFIFSGSIADNIRYARKGTVVTDDEIKEACKRACLYDFIMSLPDKFETNVGPRGLLLSGGQKQRIALARLFIQDPDIIILDEATSALDNETERIIQDSLNMFADKTMIVVAHRLSTIKDSDNIIVIDQHKVAETGNHETLMKKGGIYASMQ